MRVIMSFNFKFFSIKALPMSKKPCKNDYLYDDSAIHKAQVSTAALRFFAK